VRSVSGRLSDACGHDRLHVVGISLMSGARQQPVGANLAGEVGAFIELRTSSSMEERIAARPIGDQRQQWRHGLVIPQQVRCQRIGGRRRSGASEIWS